MAEKPKKPEVKALLDKIPSKSTRAKPPIIQEAKPTTSTEKKQAGRKSHRKEGVEYVRITPAIPAELKLKMDMAIRSTHKDQAPTIDTFVELAIIFFLENSKTL